MKTSFVAAAALAFSLFSAGPGWSQDAQNFVNAFAGDWQILDKTFAEGPGACSLELSRETAPAGGYPVSIDGCKAEMALVKGWKIEDGQMSLLDDAQTVIARLGGNQRRMSGNSSGGMPIILERVGAGGAAATLQAATRASGCVYLGFTDQCAGAAAMSLPADAAPKVQVLVNLNIRSEARDDASVLGVVQANTCVATDLCVTASDGVWCRAKFGDQAGWLRKFALRQSRWPVVTFLNACAPTNG